MYILTYPLLSHSTCRKVVGLGLIEDFARARSARNKVEII